MVPAGPGPGGGQPEWTQAAADEYVVGDPSTL